MDVCHSFVQDLETRDESKVLYRETQKNKNQVGEDRLADICTKALSKARHEDHCGQTGLVGV
jgi:hypothetical protein